MQTHLETGYQDINLDRHRRGCKHSLTHAWEHVETLKGKVFKVILRLMMFSPKVMMLVERMMMMINKERHTKWNKFAITTGHGTKVSLEEMLPSSEGVVVQCLSRNREDYININQCTTLILTAREWRLQRKDTVFVLVICSLQLSISTNGVSWSLTLLELSLVQCSSSVFILY